MKNNRGFTLIEILIATVILAVISTMTAMNIKRSVKLKNKIEADLDDYSAVRDALVIITHDINTAFHWIDINAEIKKQLAGSATPTPGPGMPVSSMAAEMVPTEKLTSFDGETDSLYLTTLSHVRTTRNSQESDQAKIGYFLKSVKSLTNKGGTKALMRSESPILDGEPKKGGKETILLENVKTLKFRFMGGDDKEWLETWKGSDSDDSNVKHKFPDAVEITLETVKNGKTISLSTMATIHNTFNDLLTNLTSSPAPGGSASGSATPTATPTATPRS